jgi:hypothetical protein
MGINTDSNKHPLFGLGYQRSDQPNHQKTYHFLGIRYDCGVAGYISIVFEPPAIIHCTLATFYYNQYK